MNSGLFKNIINKMYLQIIFTFNMYKKDLALNNLQGLIGYKTKIINQPCLYHLNITKQIIFVLFIGLEKKM